MESEKNILGLLSAKEEIWSGATESNDPYAGYTLNQFLNVAISTCDSIDLLSSMKLDEDINVSEIIENAKENIRSNEYVANVTGILKSNLKYSADGKIEGIKFKCPQCGKELDAIPKSGFCSTKCAMSFLKDKILKMISSQQGQQSSISKKLQIIIDYINIAINLSTVLPGIVIHISSLSNTYRKYLTILLNKAFLKLRLIVNKILIWKNKLIEKILKWISSGTISTYIETIFSWLKVFLQTLNSLKVAFNTAYGVAMNAINLISKLYGLPGETMGFLSGMLPRSIINHPGKMLVELPVKTLNLKQSAFQNVNIDWIENLIVAAFPPITAPEYFIDPAAFRVRVLLSDQNISVVKPIITTIEKITKTGAEFLPSYENLKFTNVWFLVAMIFGWGPTTQSIYGAIV